VTDEQRSRRPIFITTPWAGARWLFFRVARSTRMTQIWALLPPVRLGPRLEKQPTDLRQNTSYFGDKTEWRFYEAADFVKTRWKIISFIFDPFCRHLTITHLFGFGA
jgi:hypothetical protein